MQTKKHTPYNFLQPIQSLLVSFFTLILDFILAFFLYKEGFNALILVIYKFSKWVILIEGKNTWTAEEWAYTFLNILDLVDWGFSKTLIIDRNPKFFNKFWTGLFEKLVVKLLYSTAYHPQTNGISKKTNQIVEINLRFFVHTLKNPAYWP